MKAEDFIKIFYKYDNHNNLNLKFINLNSEVILFFNGFSVIEKNDPNLVKEEYHLLDYNLEGKNLRITRISQDFDVTFFEISNGDIIQVYRVSYDEDSNQVISIFDRSFESVSTPLGINAYQAAIKRAKEADEILYN